MNDNGNIEDALTPILTFSVDLQHYGLLIDEVIEVASMVALINVPEARPELLGVANRHGVALPMLDLRRVLGDEGDEIDVTTMFIVAVHRDQRAQPVEEGRLVGLVVDEVNHVEYLESEKLADMMTSGKYVRGIIGRESGLVQILALAPLVAAYLEDVRTDGQYFESEPG